MAANSEHIVDASFALSFLLPDESIEEVDMVFDRHKQREILLISAPILPFEVLNGLKSAILSKRISIQEALGHAVDFFELRIELMDIDHIESLELSQKHDLSYYDTCYLYLAQTRGAPLLTLDERLKNLH